MSHDNRVVWNEGMFLRVQHFQQADRWIEGTLTSLVRTLIPFTWGLSSLGVNTSLLGNGRFGLNEVAGIMQDGTVFTAPGSADLPAPIDLDDTLKNKIVYLCLPTQQPGIAEIDNDVGSAKVVRYKPQKYEAFDTNFGSSLAIPIDVGRLKLQFRLEGSDLSGYERIPLARIVEVKQDQSVILDETFIPTVLNFSCSLLLNNLANEILGIIKHRAEAIADRMGDPSIRGTAEISDFQFLQLLNRVEALLRHYTENAVSTHPHVLYGLLVQIAGEISTFTKERRRGVGFPGYRHDDLKSSFDPVVADIRTSLSTVLERSAIEVPFKERNHGIRVAMVTDRSLLSNAGFVLAVRSDLPQEALRSSFPRQVKIGPVEKIAELVNVALPGISAAPLPVAPRQLPYRPGTTYFELDQDTPLWKQLNTTGGVALHLAGDFPAIEIELWAIKV